MAIFNRKEELNLLTEFYQLEFDPETPVDSELDQWLLLQRFRPFGQYAEYGLDDKSIIEKHRSSTRMFANNPEPRALLTDELHRTAELYWVTRRFMDLMADGDPLMFTPTDDYDGPIDWRSRDLPFDMCCEWMKRKALTLRPQLARRYVGKGFWEPNPDLNKPFGLYFADDTTGRGAIPTVKTDTLLLTELLRALDRGRSAFRRCEECQSVFITNGKANHRFCSVRCQNRVGARRYSERKKQNSIAN